MDSTPPELVCPSPPFGQEYDTADPVTVDFDLDDGPTGSGVASQSATIDGFEVLPGVVAIVDGESIDTYDFYVGVRTVTVTAADHLGNSATGACSFEIHATAASLRENVDRGLADGDIASNMAKPLQAKLEHAQAKHERGQHAVEARAVAAFVNGVEAQSGKKIDSVLAARLIAAGLDVVDRQP